MQQVIEGEGDAQEIYEDALSLLLTEFKDRFLWGNEVIPQPFNYLVVRPRS